MKKIMILFIVIFSLLIINVVEYECFEMEEAFTNIERTMLKDNEFIQNGVKLEYLIDHSIEEEKERIINLLEENKDIEVVVINKTMIISDEEFQYEVKLIDGEKTKVEITLINNVDKFSTIELRQALEKFEIGESEGIRSYCFAKVKINKKNKSRLSSILSELKENTIEEAEISNGKIYKGNISDGSKINIGQINYDTGEYLIIGTPVIFVTY